MMGSHLVADPDDDFDNGWDNRVTLVDGRWVDRSPRFPDREPQLRRELALLPWLAPQLPLPVPVPRLVADEPFTLRHDYLPGGPCPGTSASHGRAVGEFLRVLHAVDPDDAVHHGARDAEASRAELLAVLDRMSAAVLPLLPPHVAASAEALLARRRTPPPVARLNHGDLGPEHLRVTGDRVTGVIDWGDCCVGDPAIDLAWTVSGASPAFGDAVVTSYGADDAMLARGRDLHLLGPWHEVLFGLGDGGPEFVRSGLAGTVSRLERFGRV
jgi:aminoglycoside phosphotransferase (APT) family kinase protein